MVGKPMVFFLFPPAFCTELSNRLFHLIKRLPMHPHKKNTGRAGVNIVAEN